MYALANICRYGVAESYDRAQGHRFFEDCPGFYGFRPPKQGKCHSYMVAQQLQEDSNVWWYAKVEMLADWRLRYTRSEKATDQAVFRPGSCSTVAIHLKGVNLEMATPNDSAFFGYDGQYEAPDVEPGRWSEEFELQGSWFLSQAPSTPPGDTPAAPSTQTTHTPNGKHKQGQMPNQQTYQSQ